MKKDWLLPMALLLLTLSVVISGCCKEEDDDEPAGPSGKVVLNFLHHLDGTPVSFDSTGYVNEAGNVYEVNEIQYFISDVTFHKDDGGKVVIGKEIDIYYIDSDIPATQRWQVFDAIPEGTYSGISFTFGINESKNNSFMFVNPPEVNMVWPEFLGGGYHYLKLNGKWQDTLYLRPFNFHMGIGQIYDPPGTYHPDSITGFVHNYFEAVLPNSGFSISDNQSLDIDIIMQIEEWFKNPVTWDHNVFGNYTMQNQAAMHAMKLNGANVFKAGDIK